MWPFTRRSRTELVYPTEFLSFVRRHNEVDSNLRYQLKQFVQEKFQIDSDIVITKYPFWFTTIGYILIPGGSKEEHRKSIQDALSHAITSHDWIPDSHKIVFTKNSWG